MSLLAARPERGRACRLRRCGDPCPADAASPWFRAASRRAAPTKNCTQQRCGRGLRCSRWPRVHLSLISLWLFPVRRLRGFSLWFGWPAGAVRCVPSPVLGGFAPLGGAALRLVLVGGVSAWRALPPLLASRRPPRGVRRLRARPLPPPRLRFASLQGWATCYWAFLGGACRSCLGLLLALGIKCLCGFAASLSIFLVLLRVWLGDLFAPHGSACRALRHLGFGFFCCLGGRVPYIFHICVSQNILKSPPSGARCVSLSTAKYCGGKFDTTVGGF